MNAILSVFPVGVENDFGVRLRGKLVASSEEIFAKLDVIKDFAVERDPQIAVHRGHRLGAAGDINDAEPRTRQSRGPFNMDGVRIRTSMADGGDHGSELIGLWLAAVEFQDSGNSAHELRTIISSLNSGTAER